MRTTTTLAAVTGLGLLALVATPAQAATYSAGLDFAADDQSMWQQGAAGILDFDRFIGPQWNTGVQSVGGIAHLETPEITLVPEVCAWGVCTPEVTIPAVNFGDFGARVQGSTSGAIGFDVDFFANTGAVDVAYPGTADFEYPDPHEILPGVGTLAISTLFDEGAGTSLSTVFPYAEFELDFVFEIHANAGIQVCVVSCVGTNFGVNIDETLPLLDIDSNEVATEFAVGPINIAAQLPDSDMNTSATGVDGAGNLVANASDPADALFDLDIDIDDIITTLAGLPPLGADLSLGGSSIGYTLLDVLVGAEVRLIQRFVFDPQLMVRLDAADGQSVVGAVGANGIANDLLFNTFTNTETLVTPTFFLQNTFRNTTSLVITPTFDLEALEAHLILDLPSFANNSPFNIPDPNLQFGPLFECHIPGNCGAGISGTFAVFDEAWQIPFAPIVGESFVVRIPEPATLTLFSFALALFGVGALRDRRRRRQQDAA